jgi:hypothetical protein
MGVMKEPCMSEQIQPRRTIPPAPVHPLAALATIVLDNVFLVVDLVSGPAIVFTSLGLGVVGAVTTALVQRYLARDEWGPAIAKGLVMGVIAGVPFNVTGTAVGVPLLAWAGIHKWIKLPAARGDDREQLPPGGEIVDVDPKNE